MRTSALACLIALAAGGCAKGAAGDGPDGGSFEPDGSTGTVSLDAPCEPPPSPTMFEFSGAQEMFEVPACITSITVEAFGAQGGDGTLPAATGGLGARVKGTFDVQPGDLLTILVGGAGSPGVQFAVRNGQGGGGGGGGTFVVLGISPILVAGGGGGATSNDNPQVNIAVPGGPGQITEDGQPGDGGNIGAGGTGGNGGTTGSNPGGFHVGTGGGGLSGPGIGNSNGNTGAYGTANMPGQSFLDGGAGGLGGNQGHNGGFGGGGAAGFTGGGGGGYSGGGTGSIINVTRGGGGGGSLVSGTDPESEAGIQTGDGLVIVSW